MADDAAAEESAFLARLQRRRKEMASIMRGSKHAHMQPPPVFELAKRGLEELSVVPSVLESQSQLDEQQQHKVAVAHRLTAAAKMRHGGQARLVAVDPASFADIFNTARRLEDGFGRLSHCGIGSSGGDIRLHSDLYGHRIRKGAGKRAGLALSCDGWGTPSSTLR
jgi:hypothetical protein